MPSSISTLNLLSYIIFLKHKESIDALKPRGPILRLAAAKALRNVGILIKDQNSKKSINTISKKMFSESFDGLNGLWDTDDDIFEGENSWLNPWPKWVYDLVMGPRPEPWKAIETDVKGPGPEPWLVGSATEQIILANLIMNLTEIADLEEYSSELKNIASSIVKYEAENLLKDFSVNNRQMS